MAWQVVADGAMVEVVLDTRNGREVTRTQILREGTIIPQELSKSMVDRYDDNDQYVRSIVQRVELSEDEEGNTVITAAGKPASEAPQTDEEAVKRTEAAEAAAATAKQEADDLAQQKADLEQKLAEAQAEIKEAEEAATAPQPFNWSLLSPEALAAEATKRGIMPTAGSGANGNVVKADLVQVLEASDKTP